MQRSRIQFATTAATTAVVCPSATSAHRLHSASGGSCRPQSGKMRRQDHPAHVLTVRPGPGEWLLFLLTSRSRLCELLVNQVSINNWRPLTKGSDLAIASPHCFIGDSFLCNELNFKLQLVERLGGGGVPLTVKLNRPSQWPGTEVNSFHGNRQLANHFDRRQPVTCESQVVKFSILPDLSRLRKNGLIFRH